MSPSREEVAAFADGELDPKRHAELAAAVEADPALAEQVRAHRALREQLSAHFAPVMTAPLPEKLVAPLQVQNDAVPNLAEARRKREVRSSGSFGRWSWIAAPALAASLALALFIPRGGQGEQIDGELAAALDQQLVATQAPDADQWILLSFLNESGEYCRAFTSPAQAGIACRGPRGWELEETGAGAGPDTGEYRMAGNSSAELLEQAQEMAVGPALDAAGERYARARGWQ